MHDEITRFRQTVAGVGLLLFPVLQVASQAIWPDDSGSDAAQLAHAAAQSGRWQAAALLELASWAVLIPGVVAVVGLIRARGARLATAGGTLVVLGILGFAASTALAVLQAVMAKQPNRAAMVGLAHDMKSSVLAVYLVLILLGLIGLVILAAAARRADMVPRWAPWLMAAAVVLDTVGAEVKPIALVDPLLVGVALAPIALRFTGIGRDGMGRAASGPRRRGLEVSNEAQARIRA